MNIGALLVLSKLYESLGPVSPIGPPEPPKNECDKSYHRRADGKYTFAGYKKCVDPAASGTDYQDYLKE